MCGEAAVQTMTASLGEYAPKLLHYVGYEESETIGEKEMILVLESFVQPSGLDAVFSLHEVSNQLANGLYVHNYCV